MHGNTPEEIRLIIEEEIEKTLQLCDPSLDPAWGETATLYRGGSGRTAERLSVGRAWTTVLEMAKLFETTSRRVAFPARQRVRQVACLSGDQSHRAC